MPIIRLSDQKDEKNFLPLLGHVLTERLLSMPGLAPDIPEDLYMLIKKVSRFSEYWLQRQTKTHLFILGGSRFCSQQVPPR